MFLNLGHFLAEVFFGKVFFKTRLNCTSTTNVKKCKDTEALLIFAGDLSQRSFVLLPLWQLFDKLDKNKDGVLTKDEMNNKALVEALRPYQIVYEDQRSDEEVEAEREELEQRAKVNEELGDDHGEGDYDQLQHEEEEL